MVAHLLALDVAGLTLLYLHQGQKGGMDHLDLVVDFIRKEIETDKFMVSGEMLTILSFRLHL